MLTIYTFWWTWSFRYNKTMKIFDWFLDEFAIKTSCYNYYDFIFARVQFLMENKLELMEKECSIELKIWWEIIGFFCLSQQFLTMKQTYNRILDFNVSESFRVQMICFLKYVARIV